MLMNSTVLALALFGMASPTLPSRAQAEDAPVVALDPADALDDLGAADAEMEPGSEQLPVAVPMANYSDGQLSIDYPAAWQIAVNQDGGVQIVDGTKGSPDEVVTDIFVVDSPPGVLINANIDSFISEGSVVGSYGQVKIDDQQAFTIWLSERPRTLSRAIATFIGYDDQTVFLFSSFTPENEAVEVSLLALHNSFKKIADDNTRLQSTEPQITRRQTTESQTTESQTTESQSKLVPEDQQN